MGNKQRSKRKPKSSKARSQARKPGTGPKTADRTRRAKRLTGKISIPAKVGWLCFGCAVVFYLVAVLWSAWVCDDAYITFRTIDNFVNGRGLTWNPFQRVQTYTHPLWMLLNSLVYLFTKESFFSSIFLSAAVSAAAVLVLGIPLARTPRIAVLSIGTAMLSKAFVDYSTSGMENPLTHLLLAVFVLVLTRFNNDLKGVFYLSLLSGLCLLNRMDLAVFAFPALVYACCKTRTPKVAYALLAGLGPLVVWLCFSLFYYGFLFPNTAYAKLNTGLDRSDLFWQGLCYLWSSLRIDPLTIVTMAGAVAATVALRAYGLLPVSAGILLYVLYVVSIGGDFMSGRFFSAPFFAAVCVIARLATRLGTQKFVLVCASVAILGIFPSRSPVRFSTELERLKDHCKIEDERAFYAGCASLRAVEPHREIPDCDLARKGREAQKANLELNVRGSVGYFGYFAGPQTRIIDRFAITDPLLSRLPMERYDNWRIGHFRRKIPAGYVDTVKTGRNHIQDIGLAEYYDKLSLVIEGALFDSTRVKEIWRLNTGQYDHLIDFEKYRAPGAFTR